MNGAGERIPAERDGKAAWSPMPGLTNVLLLAGIVSGLIILATLLFGGWSYYRTAPRLRGFDPRHAWLRPAGRAGQIFGISGTLVMLGTFVYVLRKKSRRLSRIGTAKNWLEAHIFCGIVGPVLVTLHTSFKFNGVISVAFWCMVLVVASGFVGRYLYVRVPKTLRGTEVSHAELSARAAELAAEIAASGLPPSVSASLDAFDKYAASASEHGILAFLAGEHRLKRELSRLRVEVRRAGVDAGRLAGIVDVIRERAVLRRRIAYLSRTKKLFSLWHVFHKPLVYVMLAIAVVHVAVAIYLGYALVPW